MTPFQYINAQSIDSAIALAGPNDRYMAGGNDLLLEMKENIVSPNSLINIKHVPGLSGISRDGSKWILGATTKIATVAADPELQQSLPGLCEAASEVGSPQIRNAATLGGNLAQHSRCWYYRHRDIQCLKRGGATCYAHDGDSRYNAIFTGNPCISTTPSNFATALAALDARIIIRRGKDLLTWTVPQFYQEAWENPLAQNSLKPGDLILRVEVNDTGSRSAYRQISQKAEFDWALVSCAASARVDGGKLYSARIAVGAVSPVPHENPKVPALLEGKRLDESLAEQAAVALLDGAKPTPSNAYKVPMAIALAKRTLLALTA